MEQGKEIILYHPVVYNDRVPFHSIFLSFHHPTGFRAIHSAACTGSEKVVSALLKKGHDPQLIDSLTGWTPLMYAVSVGNEAVSKRLLEICDMNVNAMGRDGCTPLYLAATNGHEPILRRLLEQKSLDVNLRLGVNFYTPLIAAILDGMNVVVGVLTSIDQVDVNCRLGDGWSALHHACSYGREIAAAVYLLARKDIKVNFRIDEKPDKEAHNQDVVGIFRFSQYHDCTPLMVTAMSDNEDAVKVLLKQDGLDMTCRNRRGRTALMLAYEDGNERIVSLLEDAGAEGEIPAIELQDYSHDSVLKRRRLLLN